MMSGFSLIDNSPRLDTGGPPSQRPPLSEFVRKNQTRGHSEYVSGIHDNLNEIQPAGRISEVNVSRI
jgi:hypothetical protein